MSNLATWEHTFGAMQYYTLDENRNPLPVSMEEHLALLNEDRKLKRDRRRVGWDEVEDYQISTVFLELDHNMWNPGDPILFETMIFGPEEPPDQMQWRYRTYEEALEGHHRAVTYVERFLHAKRLALPTPPTPALDQTANALDQRAMDAFMDDVLSREEPLGLYSGKTSEEPPDLLDLEPGGHDGHEGPELP